MDPKDNLTDPKLLITDANLQIDNPNNPRMPAGMTFLGQFLDHDMTFDPTSSLERQSDPEHIANFRTPTFGLDHLYGAGPAGSPHLYGHPRTALAGRRRTHHLSARGSGPSAERGRDPTPGTGRLTGVSGGRPECQHFDRMPEITIL